MKILSGVRRFFHLGAFRPDPEGDLETELSFHLRQTEEEFLAQGLSPAEARDEAHRRFGNVSHYRKELGRIDRRTAARSRRLAFLEIVTQDLAYLARGLKREPGFTAAVVLTLALGIGANATLFGVVDHLLLTPPAHVKNPEAVVRLQVNRLSPFTGDPEVMAYQTFEDYQDFLGAGSFESVAAFGDQEVILGRGEAAARVNAIFSTSSFFPLLGVNPAMGRFFDESDDEPGASGVVVLSHGLWQRRFGGREDVLGQSLSIGDGTYSVIGVTPEGFNGVELAPAELFVPIHAYTTHTGSDRWTAHRGYYWLQILGRLASASSRTAAIDEATALHRNGRREMIDEGRYPEDAQILLGSIKAALGPDAPGEIQVSRWLIGVTFIVLLIACANVANLLLARGARRKRELGIRVALGISRRRLVGQLFLESLVLAGLGGAVGLGFAYWGGPLMRTTFLPDVAWNASPVNSRVLLFTFCVAIATGLLAGMAPAWRGADEGVVNSLKEGGRGGTRRRGRSQTALLVAQAALSVVLLVGAGLFVRSLQRAQTMDLGLEPQGVILAELQLDGEWEAEAELNLANRALERLKALPGVASVSVATSTPFWGMMAFDFFVPGMDSIPATVNRGPFVTAGSPEHLSTLGIQLREGRMFTDQEATSGAMVAVLTENMARGLWPTESALGQCFKLNDLESACWEVVGVVEESRLTNLTGDIPWQYYLPMGEAAVSIGMDPGALFIRTQGDPGALLSTVRRELRNLDPSIRFAHVRLLQDLIDPHLRSWRLGATMFSLFGFLALLVATVGLYSVLAFNVTRRTRELGVRSAMGASRTRLLNMVLRQAVGVTAVGVFLGLTVAFFASNSLGPLLFNTSPRDSAVMLGVAGVLLIVALVAGAIPAWAAAKVDPMRALRTD
jgi:predicted permease